MAHADCFEKCLEEASKRDTWWDSESVVERYVRSLFSTDEEYNTVMSNVYQLAKTVYSKENGVELYDGDEICIGIWKDDEELEKNGTVPKGFRLGVNL